MAPQPRENPQYLTRVTDSATYVKYDPRDGFRWPIDTSSKPFTDRITPEAVSTHLRMQQGRPDSGLFSLCGSQAVVHDDVQYRAMLGRSNINLYKIDTTGLTWKRQQWNQEIELNYLGDEDDEIMIFKATELIDAFRPLFTADQAVAMHPTDEWIAWDSIPDEIVMSCHRHSQQNNPHTSNGFH